MAHHHTNQCTSSAAFTLRELIVVIAMLSLLSGMLLSALHQRASWQIKKAQCAANLRQFALATQLYAAENRDKLPEQTLSSAWAWDLQTTIADTLLRYGMKRRTFYCPGTAPQFNDQLNFLNPAPNSLWNYSGGSSFHITGYAHTFGPNSSLSLSNQNTTILPEPPKINSFTYLPIAAEADRILLADATISESRNGTAANPLPAGSFAFVVGSFTRPHTSPHLAGNLPAGGNLAFKDGHIAWRKFQHMSQRATTGPGFWW